MDTDSFILEIETDDFYQDTKKDLKEWFGTSKYHLVLPKDYRENASLNKKVIGKMRDELNKGHMSQCIALSPKVSAGIWDKDIVLPKDYRENGSLNKNVIGKMKDEFNKGHMSEFIALSPKVYAYQQVQVDKTLTEHKKKLEVPVNV